MLTQPLKTLYSSKAEGWYDQWVNSETYGLEPSEVRIERIPIVGMRHQGVSEDLVLDGELELVPDPENEFDPNAIKVLYYGKQIGWVPRKDTALIHQRDFHQEDKDLYNIPKLISGKGLFIYLLSLV